MERGDVGRAHLVENVADREQVVAIPVFGGQFNCPDLEQFARFVHVADRKPRGERGDVHIFGAEQGVVGNHQPVPLTGGEAAGDQSAKGFADSRAADAKGQTDVLLRGDALTWRQSAREDLPAQLNEQSFGQRFAFEDLAASAAHYLIV